MKIEFYNWFYTKMESGGRMWGFNTPGVSITIEEGYFFSFTISFLFWQLTFEKNKEKV